MVSNLLVNMLECIIHVLTSCYSSVHTTFPGICMQNCRNVNVHDRLHYWPYGSLHSLTIYSGSVY